MSDATRSGDPGGDVGAPPRDRDADGAETRTESEAEAEEDAREVGSEWHVWLIAIVVIAGVVLLFAPPSLVPELLTYIGALLVLAGVIGWLVKWAIGRSG